MSISQSQMESEESVRLKKNQQRRQSSPSDTSSDEDDSQYEIHRQKIDIQIGSKLNEFKRQVSTFRNYEQQIFQLKKQNLQLRDQNSKLLQLVKNSRQDKILKKQLKEKQKQIQDLKRQISESLYYESNRCSKVQTVIPIQIEDRKYRLRTKSIKNKSKHKQSVSSEDQESVRIGAFDYTSQIKKIKTEKIILEKNFYQLQQKFLILQSEAKWMKNLALKLVNFAQKLSFVFKQQIFHPQWTLLKKAKSSWRYLKHIMKFVIKIS